MYDLISRKAAQKALMDYWGKYTMPVMPGMQGELCCSVISSIPSAVPDLTEEDWKLIRQLRSYHNGTYAKALDKLIAFADMKGR